MLRLTLRALLFLVLLAATFCAGVRFGQERPTIDGPKPRAMEYVRHLALTDDEQGAAVYMAADMLETRRPGSLRRKPVVVAVRGGEEADWVVTFTDPLWSKPYTVRCNFGKPIVDEFVSRRTEGFQLVAQ
jgi:hypothetical protein